MIKQFLIVGLAFLSLLTFCGVSPAADSPIVDVITAATGKNITASILQELPTSGRFDLTQLPPIPGVSALLTAGSQQNENTMFLFALDNQLEVQVSKVQVQPTEIFVGPFQKFGTKITEFYPSLQASQFTNPHAIAVFNKEQYRALRYNKRGKFAHRSTQIYPIFSDETFSFAGGASSDFHFSWNSGQINNTAAFYGIARLTPKLKVDGNPLGVTGPVVISGDITNDLNGLGRLFVYREVGAKKGDQFTTRIVAQQFDPNTLNFIGAPYPITKFNLTSFVDAEGIQSVAVDPSARFVAYTTFSKSCDKEILKYRLLDNNFRPTGKSKTILGCNDLKDASVGAFGLDVVRLSF